MKLNHTHYTYDDLPEFDDFIEGAIYKETSFDTLGMRYLYNIVYMRDYNENLHLQIIKPERKSHPLETYPCILYIQGSAWQKQDCFHNIPYLSKLASLGYVIAICEYLPIDKALPPRQIIETKQALRFLKKNASLFSIDKKNYFLMGDSSGAHCALLAAMTKEKYFDEKQNHQSLDVQGVISLYGALNLTMPYGFPSQDLMNINIDETMKPFLKKLNAINYIQDFQIPLLLVHGTKDTVVNTYQSVEIYNALKKEHKDVQLYLLKQSDHGGPSFWSDEMITIYDNFLRRCKNGRI